jgi:hypothetical protein
MTLVGRLTKPAHSSGVILRDTPAVLVHGPDNNLQISVALLGKWTQEVHGGFEVATPKSSPAVLFWSSDC